MTKKRIQKELKALSIQALKVSKMISKIDHFVVRDYASRLDDIANHALLWRKGIMREEYKVPRHRWTYSPPKKAEAKNE